VFTAALLSAGALGGGCCIPVYTLLGRRGVVNRDGPLPRPDVAYLEGDLGYRVRTGGQTAAPDWTAFVEFARRYFGARWGRTHLLWHLTPFL
jgi:hypothetical protein